MREVFEETGVRTEFVSILGIRHGHNIAFGKSDMFFLVALKIADGAEDHAITIQEQELAAAEWKSMDAMAGNPHISPGSHMVGYGPARCLSSFVNPRLSIQFSFYDDTPTSPAWLMDLLKDVWSR